MESNLPDDLIDIMPLHAVTEVYGTEGLLQRFNSEVASRFDPAEQRFLQHSYLVARGLHAEDQRVREPYSNHILRVATRIIGHYDVTDTNVISAGLLHDSVEDHAAVMATANPSQQKKEAFNTLAEWFNSDVASVVEGVTNPEFDENLDKNEQYLAHLTRIGEDHDPRPLVIKLSDFTDNATGIMYTTGPKLSKLATKYLPAIPIFEQSLKRSDLPFDREVIKHIYRQLDLTRRRLSAIDSSQ